MNVRDLSRFVTCAGLAGVVTGTIAWWTVRSQLADERIVVSAKAKRFAGRTVNGPFAAFEEANVIKQIALSATGGKTYGELDADDPNAGLAKEASLLRASLFTSMLSFGMAAMQVALGAVLLVIGAALRRLADHSSSGGSSSGSW